jgi:hypothetical protein
MGIWPSKRGPITNIMQSIGCNRGTVPVAVGQWYNFYEFGCYLGNVELKVIYQTERSGLELGLWISLGGKYEF